MCLLKDSDCLADDWILLGVQDSECLTLRALPKPRIVGAPAVTSNKDVPKVRAVRVQRNLLVIACGRLVRKWGLTPSSSTRY